MVPPNAVATLRRSLLIKVLSRVPPTREDVASVAQMAASRLVAIMKAQSLSFYILEGNHISFTQVCYSPSLWAGDAAKEKRFRETAAELLALKLPRGRGIVGKVIETGEPVFFRNAERQGRSAGLSAHDNAFEIQTMLTVPLKTTVTLGAIEVLNKEVRGGVGDFDREDLRLLQEFAEYLSTLIHRMADPSYQLPPDDAARFIARLSDLPLIQNPDGVAVEAGLLGVIGETVVREQGVFPYKRISENAVAVVMTNPLDYPRRERFAQASGLGIEEVAVVSRPTFETLMKRHFPHATAVSGEDINIAEVAAAINDAYGARSTTDLQPKDIEAENSAPVIQLINRIIEDAHLAGASDIHIEPTEKELIVRYRIDGICQDKLRLPRQAGAPLVNRIKIMCNLDISENRLPQDGRIVFRQYSRKNMDIDLRVAVCPTNHGEKVVMRVLDKTKSALPLTELGFSEENLARYRECIQQAYGMILHCGPTGSGKSMTLYSALGELNTRDINIQTAEDPIEYTLSGLNQTQMNRQIGLTFARALRSYLRMDPDVILVGEIRDEETAQIAVEAALTGHLLVSTLHTNDAASTIARLGEMGVEPFNIAASLVCVCAQRLVRRVCRRCSTMVDPKEREIEILGQAIGWSGKIPKAHPKGCPHCNGTGYRGRIGVHELMVNCEELTEAINKGAEAAELKRIAVRHGMRTLHQDSMFKVKVGITTMEEALANIPGDLVLGHAVAVPLPRVA